ncbi:Transcription factor AP-4 [Bulinus truncatus]|nr:Transcription factor AP-4 [Bulinus truncatus]
MYHQYAAILQHTTEYITNLEKEKTRLQAQLEHSKRLLTELGQDQSSDEGVGMLSDTSDEGGSELQNENISLRHQLETHKQQYAVLEDRNRLLEAQLLSLLQVQANHSSNNATQFGELHSVRHESRHLHHTNAFNRELTDVISSKDNLSSPVDMYQPPRPMSPTPEGHVYG